MATKTVDVVVNKGKTLFHDGVKVLENSKVTLPEDAATRLINAGYVTLYSNVMAQLTGATSAPAVSIQTAPSVQATPATAPAAS
jgi:hypothetical protein